MKRDALSYRRSRLESKVVFNLINNFCSAKILMCKASNDSPNTKIVVQAKSLDESSWGQIVSAHPRYEKRLQKLSHGNREGRTRFAERTFTGREFRCSCNKDEEENVKILEDVRM